MSQKVRPMLFSNASQAVGKPLDQDRQGDQRDYNNANEAPIRKNSDIHSLLLVRRSSHPVGLRHKGLRPSGLSLTYRTMNEIQPQPQYALCDENIEQAICY